MNINYEKINFTLFNSGFQELKNKSCVAYLGEGAWHHAYLISHQSAGKLVIRFPKDIAYGQKVEFDKTAIRAEYGGSKAYYQHANKIHPGISPDFFDYHAEEKSTYTIETYMGKQLDLGKLSKGKAFDVGYQVGSFFRELNKASHDLKGFGYLTWNGNSVEGEYQTSVSEFMSQENDQYIEEFDELLNWQGSSLQKDELKDKLIEALGSRTINKETISFTNVDTSPENILFNNGKVSLIDPRPILYYGHSFAGNFLNNYEAIFPTYFNTKRYAHNQFDKYTVELGEIANGYLAGYSGGDVGLKQLAKREQFIHLASLTANHIQLTKRLLTAREIIGVGTKDKINERIPIYLKMLQKLDIG